MDDKGRKSQLVVIRRSPYGNSLAKASLDAALSAAAFDQPVNVLFLGEGVLQLLPEQESAPIAVRNIAKLIASLPLYDIATVHVDAEALSRYAISSEDLPAGSTVLDNGAIRALIADHDHVLGF